MSKINYNEVVRKEEYHDSLMEYNINKMEKIIKNPNKSELSEYSEFVQNSLLDNDLYMVYINHIIDIVNMLEDEYNINYLLSKPYIVDKNTLRCDIYNKNKIKPTPIGEIKFYKNNTYETIIYKN